MIVRSEPAVTVVVHSVILPSPESAQLYQFNSHMHLDNTVTCETKYRDRNNLFQLYFQVQWFSQILSNLLSSKIFFFPLTFLVLSGKLTQPLTVQLTDIIKDQVHACNKLALLCLESIELLRYTPNADCPTGAKLSLDQGASSKTRRV